ncbi:MucR family transcriptional regulator [Erythrobacter sp. F6033]|uniref:MucR family transcriptional regulator n=1 Tax=Erythrobacter sp. F6033 TaxID=2926401 RepID=UPI001FF3454E|nr:MucR family transcriptional regulator [Erythrobacter sp. F6033]MCK0127939.1 MucR family transcriptional regulator [Erythrobacter sp. F6033]
MQDLEIEMKETLITLTSDIVAAHVSNNDTRVDDVPELITNVFTALSALGENAEPEEVRPEPAVSIRASIKPDYIVCLEDGKKLKMLKRYLRTNFDMTPEEYRARWELPSDYPMVAPNYAEKRRDLAKKIGLGRKPGSGRGRKKK